MYIPLELMDKRVGCNNASPWHLFEVWT